MQLKNWLADKLKQELGDAYGAQVWADQQEIIRLYEFYEGKGQDWPTNSNLDYVPTKIIANETKHLIKEEARFMFSLAPEIAIAPREKNEANIGKCAEFEAWLRSALEQSGWAGQLSKGGRDAFIGKRLAIKLTGADGQLPRVRLLPSLEFCHDVDCDTGEITQILYYYHINHDPEPKNQRTWLQKYWLKDGRCMVEQGLYDGLGELRDDPGNMPPTPTGLDFIPSCVIINDGLSADVTGESDVAELQTLAHAYNRRLSDDQDALRFNMFPQKVFTDVSQASMEGIKISPGAALDVQTEPTAVDHQATCSILESGFSYDARFENSMDRVKQSMYELLSVPMLTVEQLKALGVSGKALKMLYNPLIARCEEKWTAWDAAIRWMVRRLAEMSKAYGGPDYTGLDYTINIDHLWPIPGDEDEERRLDLQEVAAQTMSRKAYMDKWRPTADGSVELEQIAKERQQLEESAYM